MEYDGAGFAGFQRQRNLPSIQGVLESALADVTGEPTRVSAAGRTDAGAHATGQVVAFSTGSRLDDAALLRAINARLPSEVALQSLETTEERFDPRRHAKARHYLYRVLNRRVRSPLCRERAYFVAKPLDLQAMNAAADFLRGTHDFASFGNPPAGPGASTIRTIHRLDIMANDEMIDFHFVANAFMHQMIRCLVGTLLLVGEGRVGAGEVKNILEARNRSRAAPPAPAHGLYLTQVSYEGKHS